MQKKIYKNHFTGYARLLLLWCAGMFIHTQCSAQLSSQVVSQRFTMQVQDMMDLGFVNESENYTGTESLELEDLVNGKLPEYKFRIRTNEPYNISLSTNTEDSSGNKDADSIIQVKIKENGIDNQDYSDISSNPVTLINNTSESENKTLTIQYRTKPGKTISPTIKKVSVVYTASYP
jgi:hypothetical protein